MNNNLEYKTIVGSSQLKAFVYDSDKCELHIVFNNGSEYKYFDVSADEVAGFESAESKGQFFAEHFKAKKSFEKC